MSKVCKKLRKIRGCARMCRAFFEFYPMPTRETCKLVKRKWRVECNIRVSKGLKDLVVIRKRPVISLPVLIEKPVITEKQIV